MLVTALVLGVFLILNFLLIGGVIGYLTYGYLAAQTANVVVPDHPEFFDEDGNMITEELITIRFENGYWDEDDD